MGRSFGRVHGQGLFACRHQNARVDRRCEVLDLVHVLLQGAPLCIPSANDVDVLPVGRLVPQGFMSSRDKRLCSWELVNGRFGARCVEREANLQVLVGLRPSEIGPF